MRNKSDAGLFKEIGIDSVVKEQVWSKQREQTNYYTSNNSVEVNEKIEQLEKQEAQLYAALMAKQPQQQQQQ